jgi:glycosyltransferase involved in cell wall biosynthesis
VSLPPMLIDVSRLLGARLSGRQPTGVDRVSLEYVRHFGGGARAMICSGRFRAVLPRDVSAMTFAALLDPRIRFAPIATRIMGGALSCALTTPAMTGCILLNTGHTGLADQSGISACARLGAKPVVFVHDLIPIQHPEYCRPGASERHGSRMRNALAVASGIIANSRSTLGSLTQFAERSGLRCPPAVVAPLAPASLLEAGPRPIPGPYFVMIGTIEPRKNHALLLNVWRRLAERLGDTAPRLVIIGRRGWECENVIDLLERCAPLSGIVLERNDCSDAELAAYLRHAQALLMPSFAEGFGLPVVESLAIGTPVIASDLDVFREVAGAVPEYADPLDGPRWGDLVMRYADGGSSTRQAQLQRLTAYQPVTWRGHFAVVEEFLCRLTGVQPP